MKKYFKLLGITLLATSLCMVSCGKDDNNDDNNGGTEKPGPSPNPNPNPDPEPTTPEVKVTFGTETWTAANTTGFSINGGVYMGIASTEGGDEFPIVMMMTKVSSQGTYTDSFDGNSKKYTNGNFNMLDYYEQYILTAGEDQYGDWWAKTVTMNITAYNATTLTISANVSAVMFSALEAYVADHGAVGMDAASTKNMTISIKNIELQEYTGKANLASPRKGNLKIAR